MSEQAPILLEKIRPNNFNPNVMPEYEYKALLFEMKEGGIDVLDPIIVRPSLQLGSYEIVDGYHRFKAAQELGWKEIRCISREMTLDEAKKVNYRKNKERGNIDPFKEAELFKTEVDAGLTQEKIAEKYGIDRTTVAKRLSLIKLEPAVRDELLGLKKAKITVSHLEPIATLKPELQQEAAKRIADRTKGMYLDESVTVQDVEREVQRVKQTDLKRKELQSALEKSKHKTCPLCGQPALDVQFRGLPWVADKNNHEWNLETGKRYSYSYEREEREGVPKPKKPELPDYIRTTYSDEDFLKAFTEFTKELVPEFVQLESITLDGTTKDDEDAHISLYSYGGGMSFDVEVGKREVRFSIENKEYKTESLKHFKTLVRADGTPKSKKDLEKLEAKVKEFVEKYVRKGRKPSSGIKHRNGK